MVFFFVVKSKMLSKCLRLGRFECASELCATHSAKSEKNNNNKTVKHML